MERVNPFVEIDLTAIISNAQAILSLISPAELIAIVKADAYGHGAIEIAKTLENSVRMFAVATLDEAIELRQADIRTPILILFNLPPIYAETAFRHDLTLTVSEIDLPKTLSKIAQNQNRTAKIHISVNTGMNRGGVNFDHAIDFFTFVNQLPNLEIEGIYTHFAAASAPDQKMTDLQLHRFQIVIDQLRKLRLRPKIFHIANSSAAQIRSDLDFDAVRAGLILYGPLPHLENRKIRPIDLRPSLSWKTEVISVQTVSAGEAISYGCTFRADREMRTAIARIGYADGFPRSLSNVGTALIGGKNRRLLGKVCMDVSVFEADENIQIGDEVVLIGRQGDQKITIKNLAKRANNIPHEIFSRIGKRVKRIYKN